MKRKIKIFLGMGVFGLAILSITCAPKMKMPEEKLHVGDIAPLFSLPDSAGTPHELNSYILEKPTLVMFFSAGCPPCRMELKKLSQVRNYERVQGKRGLSAFNVLLVTGSTPAEVSQMEKEIGSVNFIVLYDNDKNVMKDYGIFAFPYNFLVGRDGRILLVLLGYYEDMIERINSVLVTTGG